MGSCQQYDNMAEEKTISKTLTSNELRNELEKTEGTEIIRNYTDEDNDVSGDLYILNNKEHQQILFADAKTIKKIQNEKSWIGFGTARAMVTVDENDNITSYEIECIGQAGDCFHIGHVIIIV